MQPCLNIEAQPNIAQVYLTRKYEKPDAAYSSVTVLG